MNAQGASREAEANRLQAETEGATARSSAAAMASLVQRVESIEARLKEAPEAASVGTDTGAAVGIRGSGVEPGHERGRGHHVRGEAALVMESMNRSRRS